MYFLGDGGALGKVIEGPASAKVTEGTKDEELNGCADSTRAIGQSNSREPISADSSIDKFAPPSKRK